MGDGKHAARRSLRASLLALSDRYPTSAVGGTILGLFLVATISVGGLHDAKAEEAVTLKQGESFENLAVRFTATKALSLDELPPLASTKEGKRYIAVAVTAENRFDEPVSLPAGGTGAMQTLRVEGLPAQATAIARVDDASQSVVLQPGVPEKLVILWQVEAKDWSAKRDVDLHFSTLTRAEGKIVVDGEFWDSPTLSATQRLALEIKDVAPPGGDTAPRDAEGRP